MLAPRGVIGTPVTPFTANNELDVGQYQKLLTFLIDSGVDGLAMPMHIGESLSLSTHERKQLIEAAIGTAAHQVPVFVHASMPGTDQTIELARHAAKAGADGIVVVTPYYWAPGPDALMRHYREVGAAIDIGMTAYNFPEKLGVVITTDLIAQLLSEVPTFVGLKDASLNMDYFTEVCRITSAERPGFAVLTGAEYLLPAMSVGAAGSFSGCGAVAPRMVRDLYAACVSRNYERALELQFRVSAVWNAIRVEYPAGIKVAMELMGRPVGKSRGPVGKISEEGRADMGRAFESVGVFDTEPIGWEFA